MSDQQRAEALDDDKLGAEVPPEEPLGVEEYGTTPAEEAWDEPLEERIAREEPDVPVGDHERGEPSDPTLSDVAQEREGAVPAEEAALHVVEDPEA
ncbi:hypothetical protein HC251_02865 [Iamia sp. SCSIO 61187]|uniref:hypothetical protein n=1 Tax=Iamia sp. SCSIO 61187 TaxID=2722752 RepID=UPI001C6255DA|nr:hypothetical protein [Iamia sp. SCSIO 61187]QYG91481.1 hypothetical protein HC251_02865 [Iamia sp. SCSIO 61187]